MMLDELIAFLSPSVFSYHEKFDLDTHTAFQKDNLPKGYCDNSNINANTTINANRCSERGKQVQRERQTGAERGGERER